jgi:hypothetical protein
MMKMMTGREKKVKKENKMRDLEIKKKKKLERRN